MGFLINTNISSLFAQRELRANTALVSRSQEKLATGSRIVESADDPIGIAFSEAYKDQVQYSRQAERNIQDGISLLNIVDGALSSIANNLQRMREIVVQAGSDTLGSEQLNAIAQELASLAEENDQIAVSTKFNGIYLLDGSATSFKIQIGGKSSTIDNTVDLTTALADSQNAAIGVLGGSAGFAAITDIWNPAAQTTQLTNGNVARSFLADLDNALNYVNNERVEVGAIQNHLETVATVLASTTEKISQANSAIRDTDIASESALLIRNQLRQQAAGSILGQTNNIRKDILAVLLQ